MGLEHDDTIAAIATPPGRGGVGVVRVSGPLAQNIAAHIVQSPLPSPRQASFKAFYNHDKEVIDHGLVLFFKGPHSFTGEDVVELQGHGGPVILQLLLSSALHFGARLARPGEFSERAFLNGKMDLIQAESVADLIDASTAEAAKSALQSLQGAFSKSISALSDMVLELRKFVESAIDFPDEEIDFLSKKRIQSLNASIDEKITYILNTANQGRLLKEGMMVVIIGQPNVGKSSLLNALTEQDSAIVAPIAGTTRDLIKETIQIDGLPIHIVDTAGIRLNPDIIEEQGIQKAKQQLAIADCILLVRDCTQPDTLLEAEYLQPYEDKVKVIHNKVDLIGKSPFENESGIFVSAKHNDGVQLVRSFLKRKAGFKSEGGLFMARKRHTEALTKVKTFIKAAQIQWEEYDAPECAAEELRMAHLALGEIVGTVSSDELLGHIFSSFCIGK